MNQRPLILVVNDRAEVLEEVARVLAGAGFTCRCCTTAEDAVEAAESNPPEMIISGTHLQGHSGLDMCAKIREIRTLHEVPVMFLSGTQTPDIVRRSDMGGTYYLRRPFTPDVMVELIDAALGMRQLVGAHAADG